MPLKAKSGTTRKLDKTNPPKKGGIVFVGSSSIRKWTTLSKDFPTRNVINRGFGGSTAGDSVYFADRIVTPYAPSYIVFFAGTNDIAAGQSAEMVFNNYKAFVDKVRATLPNVPILYIGITPAPSRQNKWEEFKKANALVKDYSTRRRHLRFLDTWKQFLTKDGGPRPELFVEDQLHLRPEGYAIWVKDLEPILPKTK